MPQKKRNRKPPHRHITLRGQKWRMKTRRVDDEDRGECIRAEKTITIDPDLTSFDRMDTIIHECLHGCFRDIEEDAIDPTATDIAQVLWDDGWRRIQE